MRLLPAGPRSVTLHGGNSRPAGNQHACQDCLQWGRNVPGLPPRGQVSPSQISCTPDTRVALGGLGEEGDGATEESALVRILPPGLTHGQTQGLYKCVCEGVRVCVRAYERD